MEPENANNEAHNLLVDVRRSVRYHMRRARFFDHWGMLTNGANIVLGSTAVASLFGALGGNATRIVPVVLSAAIALLSTVDLVIGSARSGRLHNDLARRFVGLEKEIVLDGKPTADAIRTFTSKRLSIEADEPPIMRTLDVLCHNELAKSMGQDKHIYPVGFFKRTLAHFLSFDHSRLKSVAEIEALKKSGPPAGGLPAK